MKARERITAFTLLELLVVVGLIAALSFVFIGGLKAGGKSAALEAGQATIGNLIVVARTRAVATGHSTRILFHSDLSAPDRLLRYLVLQEQDPATSNWSTVSDTTLPSGVYVLPQQNKIPAGMLENDITCKKIDITTVLHSSVLSDVLIPAQVNSDHSESWDSLTYNYRGTSTNSGVIVLATGEVRNPGSYASTESPIRLLNQDNVRGFSISSYGMPTYLNGRTAF